MQLALATPVKPPFEKVAMVLDPIHGDSFAPAVQSDPSLNANERALTQWIAYCNSPEGDAFHAAEPEAVVASTAFLRVAQASIPKGSADLRGE